MVADWQILVDVTTRLKNAKICVDGQKDIDVPYGLNISISKTKKTLKLVHPKDNDFFEACREKLGWSLNLSKK